MSNSMDDHYIDAPVAPSTKAELIKDRRRLDRIHNVNPTLIPLLRNAATLAIVDDIDAIPVAGVIGPVPRAIEVALLENRHFWGSLGIWPGASLGIGIFTAATVWFVMGHGSSIALDVGNLLRFIYGIGILM
jgi:hypothetical protein